MEKNAFDLVIVGAGPAGCTTALNLKDSGLKIALVDKAILPADKICGDALSGTVLNVIRRLPGNCYHDFLELEPKTPSWGIRFSAPNGALLDVPFVLKKTPETLPPGYICKRKQFDGFLQKKVTKLTSFPILNYTVKTITRQEDSFIISGDNGVLKTRMILGADGTHSTVGKILAGHTLDHDHYCLGVRTYFTGVTGLHPEHFIELHFLKQLLPGYLWIFPMENGITNVGLGMQYKKMKSSPESLSALLVKIIHTEPGLSARFSDAKMAGKIESHGLPLGPDSKAISGKGFLLAGDAASLVDPFSGEGVGNAMVSGEIAANIIKTAFTANDISAGFLSKYDNLIRKRMWRELKTSKTIQKLCSYPALFNFVVNKANRNTEFREMFTKMYTSQDVRDKLKSPGFYFRMLLR